MQSTRHNRQKYQGNKATLPDCRHGKNFPQKVRVIVTVNISCAQQHVIVFLQTSEICHSCLPPPQRNCASQLPAYMVLASLTKHFSSSGTTTTSQLLDDGGRRAGGDFRLEMSDTRRAAEAMEEMDDFEAIRPPYIHVREMVSPKVCEMEKLIG
jgi:hypothetical protein